MTLTYGRKDFNRALIFRPHNVYGPDMGWEHVIPEFVVRMKQLVQHSTGVVKFPIQGTGEETRSFVFIEDFIDGLMLVIEKGRHLEIYHIGTDQEIRIDEVAKQIGQYFGRRIEVVPGQAPEGETKRRCCDIRKLAALGYRPKYNFSRALPIVASWYDAHAREAASQPVI
jgi:nucleoside-diphosphate-sugar epimerase